MSFIDNVMHNQQNYHLNMTLSYSALQKYTIDGKKGIVRILVQLWLFCKKTPLPYGKKTRDKLWN